MPVPHLLLAPSLMAASATASFAPAEFQPVFEQLEAEKKSFCTALEGEMAVEDRPVSAVVDFNADGVVDPIVPEAVFSCSTSATLFKGGTGGATHHVFVSNAQGGYDRFDLLGHDYRIFVWNDFPVILMGVHFSVCGLDRVSTCIVSYTYEQGYFQAAGDLVPPDGEITEEEESDQ